MPEGAAMKGSELDTIKVAAAINSITTGLKAGGIAPTMVGD